MCGIFGFVINNDSHIESNIRKKIMNNLFLLSESRGSEASGFAFEYQNNINTYKTPQAASELIKEKVYLDSLFESCKNPSYSLGIGHSRLVTDGEEYNNENNQPVVKNGMALVHNGIVVNYSKLWEEFTKVSRKTDLDSEIIPVLFSHFKENNSFDYALKKLFKKIHGMSSIAVVFEEFENLLLATNNGSLYYTSDISNKSLIFCSERQIMLDLIDIIGPELLSPKIHHLYPNHAILINIKTLEKQVKPIFSDNFKSTILTNRKSVPVNEINSKSKKFVSEQKQYTPFSMGLIPSSFISHFEDSNERISQIKRCKKCVLPSSFPFIEYDKNGICNYCNNHKVFVSKGSDALLRKVDKVKNEKAGDYNCLIPLSGGRDSSYTLHYVSQELGLKPLAFSYDWGMITDLARRNQSRLCGQLGIEHILISADIRRKRDNIRKNVSAWLKNPHMGLVPIFMAGDKQYHYYSNLLLSQNNLNLSIMGDNPFEVTNFKSGFCGIRPKYGSLKNISMSDKIRMLLLYGKEYLINPAYFNKSLLDTLDAFNSYYVIKHKNINIFDYLPWNEEIIIKTLEPYEWEIANDTKSTWRIGDGTASFYNYIYYIVAGFDENDTFRSNQIREGQITRSEAKDLLIHEHYPRWKSIQWYCETIGIDFIKTINAINKIFKFYD